ncbi:hypothetical protein [Nonomuraea endophytica]|uniref:hypothetical protein n=1 Tax=Nonomuraea endophytica TaxID=714136 RepID=UPI0037C87BA0
MKHEFCLLTFAGFRSQTSFHRPDRSDHNLGSAIPTPRSQPTEVSWWSTRSSKPARTPGAPPDQDTDPPSGRVDLPVAFETWTDSGALGDARLAGPEMGQKIVAAAYERAIRFARRFAAGEAGR